MEEGTFKGKSWSAEDNGSQRMAIAQINELGIVAEEGLAKVLRFM